jgi:hypothetical protein
LCGSVSGGGGFVLSASEGEGPSASGKKGGGIGGDRPLLKGAKERTTEGWSDRWRVPRGERKDGVGGVSGRAAAIGSRRGGGAIAPGASGD